MENILKSCPYGIFQARSQDTLSILNRGKWEWDIIGIYHPLKEIEYAKNSKNSNNSKKDQDLSFDLFLLDCKGKSLKWFNSFSSFSSSSSFSSLDSKEKTRFSQCRLRYFVTCPIITKV